MSACSHRPHYLALAVKANHNLFLSGGVRVGTGMGGGSEGKKQKNKLGLLNLDLAVKGPF